MTLKIRRAGLADADETAAVFSASFRSMGMVPKIHSDDEDRVFVRGLIANRKPGSRCATVRSPEWLVSTATGLRSFTFIPIIRATTSAMRCSRPRATNGPKAFSSGPFRRTSARAAFTKSSDASPSSSPTAAANEERTPDVRYVYKGDKRRLRRLWRNIRNFSLTKDEARTPRTV